jgi:hypothetical protein
LASLRATMARPPRIGRESVSSDADWRGTGAAGRQLEATPFPSIEAPKLSCAPAYVDVVEALIADLKFLGNYDEPDSEPDARPLDEAELHAGIRATVGTQVSVAPRRGPDWNPQRRRATLAGPCFGACGQAAVGASPPPALRSHAFHTLRVGYRRRFREPR